MLGERLNVGIGLACAAIAARHHQHCLNSPACI
jgi:hypothetical protein